MWTISQTIIKDMTFNGECKKDDGTLYYCPKHIYECRLKQKISTKGTEAMNYGRFFETLCLGRCAGGQQVLDLPRKLVRGKKKQLANKFAEMEGQPLPYPPEKTTDQIRIEDQALVFKHLCNQYGVVIDEKNTQVVVEKEWKRGNLECIVRSELDIVSPIVYKGEQIEMAVIDSKLAGNIHSTWPPYCWGTPDMLNYTQADFYLMITGYEHFFYWVFDYKPKPENKFVPRKRSEDNIRLVNEAIRKVLEVIRKHENYGWESEPQVHICRYCPLCYLNGGDCEDLKEKGQITVDMLPDGDEIPF